MRRWLQHFRGIPAVIVGTALVAVITVEIVVLVALARGGRGQTQPGAPASSIPTATETATSIPITGLTEIYDRRGPDSGALLGVLSNPGQLHRPVPLESVSVWMVMAARLLEDYLIEESNEDQILEWYINRVSYGGQYVGVQAAAEGYFRKDAKDLTLAESALLAWVPQAPTRYHPRLNCDRDTRGDCVEDELGRTALAQELLERQDYVLGLMVDEGLVTPEEAEQARGEPILVHPASDPPKAAAFTDNQVEPRLVRMCEAGWLPIGDSPDCTTQVHTAGYKVTTTLDWELTELATTLIQEFIEKGLEKGCDCHNGAIATIDPQSGWVTVYAPNRDPDETSDTRVAGQIDQLIEINQPGSAFMPAVYLTWFDVLGKVPLSTLWDTSPLSIPGVVNITNPRAAPGTEGLISARAGLGGSQNVPAFRAAGEAGVGNVIEMAKRLGITTLEQGFDPTWRSHPDVIYGASIATGGANIRAIDMVYMNATVANMGTMVWVPHLAETLDLEDLRNFAFDEGEDYEEASRQFYAFSRGHIRLPGTRELDPIVILEVRDIDGNVLFQQGEPQRRQVIDSGSVWLLHSIMSDCTARFVIWGCGTSNSDFQLDFFMADGQRPQSGIKTGTQQGPNSAVDTLETWMTGYTRHAATAVWIGNADNELVRDGPEAGFAAAHTATTLWKTWMGAYHDELQARGLLTTPEGFDELQPANVAWRSVPTTTTDRIYRPDDDDFSGLCEQTVEGWVRTDIQYEQECEKAEIDTRDGLLATSDTPAQFRDRREFVKLPALRPDLARSLAENMGIPIAPPSR